MSTTRAKATLAVRGQSLGLRLLTRAGGLEAMQRPAVRARVERALYQGAKHGFRAQSVAGRAFDRKRGAGAPRRPTVTRPPGEFDLTPTEDQEMFRTVARELADEQIRPAGAAADADRQVPAAIVRQAGELGLGLLGVPADLGGVTDERSAVAGVLVLAELARGDLGIAVALLSTGSVAAALAAYGDADQQQTFLPALTADEQPAVAAFAVMETQPLFDPFLLQTRAISDGDDLVIDGVKSLVPLAEQADLFVVTALVNAESRLILVEAGTPGLEIETDPAMGIRASRTGKLHLTNVRVPRRNLLGTALDHRDAIRRSRLAWSAAAVGTAQAVLDQVRTYVLERHAFGEPIAHRQAVAFTVADMAIELDALRLVVLRAAALLDAGGDPSAQVAHARALAARHATSIGSHGVQLLGGHGFVKEFDNERWYRDLRATGMLEGGLLV